MGITHVKVTVRATEKSRKKYVADFLVDAGAIDSMASFGIEARRHSTARPQKIRTGGWFSG